MSSWFFNQFYVNNLPKTWTSRDASPEVVVKLLEKFDTHLDNIRQVSDNVDEKQFQVTRRQKTKYSVYKVTTIGPLLEELIALNEGVGTMSSGVYNKIITIKEEASGKVLLTECKSSAWIQYLYKKGVSPLPWLQFQKYLTSRKLHATFKWDPATVTMWTDAYSWVPVSEYLEVLRDVKKGNRGRISYCTPLPEVVCKPKPKTSTTVERQSSEKLIKKLKQDVQSKDKEISRLRSQLADKSRVLEFTKMQLDLTTTRLKRLETPYEI